MRLIFTVIIVVILTAPPIFGQVDWVEHPIAGSYGGAWGVYAVDMDGDSDLDK